MKYRKILLFILILFFILIIHNNCNAVVVDEGGIGKYYLQDLPFSEESYDTVYLYNSSNNSIVVFGVLKGSYLGFDVPNKTFYHMYSDGTSNPLMQLYICTLDVNTSKFIGGTWNSQWVFPDGGASSVVFSDYLNYKYVGGTTKLYPCIKGKIIKSLPINSISWDSPIVITAYNSSNYDCVIYIPEFINNSLSFKNPGGNNHLIYCYDSFNNKNLKFYCYGYYSLSDSWTELDMVTTGPWGSPCARIGEKLGCSSSVLFSCLDIIRDDNNVVIIANTNNLFNCLSENNYSTFPNILNSAEDLSKGNDDIVIMPGDFTSTEDIKFVIQKVETVGEGDEAYERHSNVFDPIILNTTSNCYRETENGGFFYVVPWSSIKDKLVKDTQYVYVLSYTYKEKTYTKELYSTYGGLTESDIIQNSIDEQTKVFKEYYERQETLIKEQTTLQEEQNETSKGIWGTLKEVLSYINPFSENFFVYKLIELLINALKSLFIPEDGFLNNYFNELKEWFSARLGFLAYPLDLILDVLERIKTINFEEPIIQIPDFVEPSTNEKIIAARTYNLNSLLENNTFKTCHDVYFVLVDAIIIFGLVNLLKNKLEEVFTK